MNRPVRIAFNALAPPQVASLLLFATAVIFIPHSASTQPGELAAAANFVPYVLIYAYLFAGIPSFIHAIFLEWLYHHHPANTWKACFASGASGALAGVLIDCVFLITSQRTAVDEWVLFFPAVGLADGLVLGVAVKFLSGCACPANTHSLRGREQQTPVL